MHQYTVLVHSIKHYDKTSKVKIISVRNRCKFSRIVKVFNINRKALVYIKFTGEDRRADLGWLY